MRNLRWLLSLSLLAGVLVGAAMMYAAWQHHPQCEVHCPEAGVSWGHWLAIGASWAIPAAAVFLLAAAIPVYVIRTRLPKSSPERTR